MMLQGESATAAELSLGCWEAARGENVGRWGQGRLSLQGWRDTN